MRPFRGVSVIGLTLGFAFSAGGTPVSAQERPSQQPATQTVDAIVVTANRREELAQDVPIAITAFSPGRLQQQGITKEQDLLGKVPSLIVGPNGQGSRDSQSFTLRGQGSSFQASPGVVVYLDEVPLPAAITLSQQGAQGNFVDLESLQVLAGPQGTLFGRNTTGGAVLLVPKKPTNEFGGWLQGEFGNYNRAYIEGAVNLPLVHDKVLLRVAGAYHSRDGFTRDVVWNKDRDNENWHSGRIGLTLRPYDGVENYTMLYFANSDNNGAGLVHRGFNIDGLKAIGFCADPPATPGPIGVPCDVYRAFTTRANALGPRKTAFSVDTLQKNRTWGLNNTSTIAVGDTIKLRNIISFQKLRLAYRYDGDATPLQQHDLDPGVLPAAGVVSMPLLNFPITYNNATLATELPLDDLKQFTEELQFQGKALDGSLDWTGGGFYYEQKPDGPQGTRGLAYCPALFTGFCEPSYARYGTSTVSKALYAQATLDLSALTASLDRVRLTAGYRYTWDTIDGFTSRYSRSSTDPTLAVCAADNRVVSFATALADCRYEAKLRTKAPSWLIGLDYKVTPNALLYAKVSHGYKAGGFNQYAVFVSTRTFVPEKVTSYETGIKSDFELAGAPISFDLAAYRLNYKDIQRATADFNPATFAAGARTLNADARISGVELEAAIRPVAGFELGGNFGLTDAKYTKYSYVLPVGGVACNGVVAPGGIGDSSCLPFQYTAKYIWNLHASYDADLGGGAGKLSFFVNYAHTSSQNTEAVQMLALQPGAILKPYGLLNASLDWQNALGGPADIGIFGTNLTNETYRISNTDVFQQGGLLYWSTLYGEPRMYGVRVKIRFGHD